MFKILLRTLKFIGSYKKRVIAAFVFSFFRAISINSPLILAYLVIMNFYKGTPDPHIVLYTSLGVVGSILLQALLAHTSDRLQSGAGFEVFADKRIELAEHLRKLPMGFFTEGNIGRISSILSTDMVFIEENAMSILAVTLYLNVHGSITNINTIGILLFLINIFTPIKSIYGYSASFASGKKNDDSISRSIRRWQEYSCQSVSQISMVFQRVYLFHDTIYNNIAIGCENVTREKVIEAAKKARCYDFIMALPNGFDTVIDEGGSSLSGGERQRISIARCIPKDAPIVILDEATASIDADNERYIQEAISELCKGKTLLVIAHRLQTIRYADQIMVISNGQVKERGTHKELMERGQIYKTFVMKKSSNIIWKSA